MHLQQIHKVQLLFIHHRLNKLFKDKEQPILQIPMDNTRAIEAKSEKLKS